MLNIKILMFGEFMIKVLERADTLIYDERECSLCDVCGIRSTVLKIVKEILREDWNEYDNCARLVEVSYDSYIVSCGNIVRWLFGLTTMNKLSYWNKNDVVNLLYENRKFVMDVARIGRIYYPNLQSINKNESFYVDMAAVELLKLQTKNI